MRRIIFSLTVTSLVIAFVGSSSVLMSKATQFSEGSVATQAHGTRCTRLTYPPLETSPERSTPPGAESQGSLSSNSRCPRLSVGPRQGEFLPNTPPKVGLSASTSYLGPDAGSEVKLKAIACDLEDDENLLYTYSTTGGRLVGDGADTVWNLSGVRRPGQYIVSVEVDDGCGCISFANAQVTVGDFK